MMDIKILFAKIRQTKCVLCQLIIFTLLIGCALRPQSPQVSLTVDMLDVFNPPQIDNGSTRYYFSPWHPGCKVLTIRYDSMDGILSIKSEYIHHLDSYMPMLIESLKDTGNPEDRGIRASALRFLWHGMAVEFPDSRDSDLPWITESPLTRAYYPKWNKTTYDKWKQWWENTPYGKSQSRF